MVTSKHPKESLTILTDMVLPGETNALNNLFGGELLARMDRACSIAAQRHSRRIVVTASVNHVAFNRSVPLGSVVTIEAKVSRAFSSSMEVFLDVWVDDRESGDRTKANEAIYTFVAVDETVRNNNGDSKDVKQPLPLPKGVSNRAVGRPMPEPEFIWLSLISLLLVAFRFCQSKYYAIRS